MLDKCMDSPESEVGLSIYGTSTGSGHSNETCTTDNSRWQFSEVVACNRADNRYRCCVNTIKSNKLEQADVSWYFEKQAGKKGGGSKSSVKGWFVLLLTATIILSGI